MPEVEDPLLNHILPSLLATMAELYITLQSAKGTLFHAVTARDAQEVRQDDLSVPSGLTPQLRSQKK